MRHCMRIAEELPVSRVMDQLDSHPELWDAQPLRTKFTGTPFGETSDIWVRFGKDAALWSEPHFAEWWSAWYELPALHPLVFHVMYLCEAAILGGILITKVPPKKRVHPHTDKGQWHPEFYTTKAYLILQSNPDCVNTFEGESVHMETGSAWLFENRVMHGVVNGGDTDRIAVVICMRK